MNFSSLVLILGSFLALGGCVTTGSAPTGSHMPGVATPYGYVTWVVSNDGYDILVNGRPTTLKFRNIENLEYRGAFDTRQFGRTLAFSASRPDCPTVAPVFGIKVNDLGKVEYSSFADWGNCAAEAELRTTGDELILSQPANAMTGHPGGEWRMAADGKFYEKINRSFGVAPAAQPVIPSSALPKPPEILNDPIRETGGRKKGKPPPKPTEPLKPRKIEAQPQISSTSISAGDGQGPTGPVPTKVPVPAAPSPDPISLDLIRKQMQ